MVQKKRNFDLKRIDRSVKPQNDFFQFANGGWFKNNPIPSTKNRWGSFYELRETSIKNLHSIVTDLSKKKRLKKNTNEQRIRDFFLSGMDSKRRNQLKTEPLKPWFKRIDSINTREDLLSFITYCYKNAIHFPFSVSVGPDDKRSDENITVLSQSGLSMPNRDFYLMNDAHSKEIRKKFLSFAEDVLVLSGASRSQAKKDAATLLSFETKLAKVSMDKVDCRNIDKVYNKKSISMLQKSAPVIDWREFFGAIGLKNVKTVLVYHPGFIDGVSELLESAPLSTWKLYCKWMVIDDFAPLLTDAFAKRRFSFYGTVLAGIPEMEPRWKRVLGMLEVHIGEALGKAYVDRFFPPESKRKIEQLVDDLLEAYTERIKNIDWMSTATKKKALLKLTQMNTKLGYPDKWKSFTGLRIDPKDYVGNALRASIFEQKKEFKKLGKKVDRSEWHMTPQTVNAYFAPNLNDIVFPAGILQPPFFDPKADDALNYGAIGSVIGHEITHGFDDEGSKFDGRGNYKDWWTKEDRKRFEKKAAVLVKQFNQYKVGNLSVNGKLTLGENIADLGGASIAFDAYMNHLQKTNSREDIHGYSPEQRFFFGLATVECVHERPESARTMVLIDPHSPPKFRINGPVSNLPEFCAAFNVSKKDKLYRAPKDRAKIW